MQPTRGYSSPVSKPSNFKKEKLSAKKSLSYLQSVKLTEVVSQSSYWNNKEKIGKLKELERLIHELGKDIEEESATRKNEKSSDKDKAERIPLWLKKFENIQTSIHDLLEDSSKDKKLNKELKNHDDVQATRYLSKTLKNVIRSGLTQLSSQKHQEPLLQGVNSYRSTNYRLKTEVGTKSAEVFEKFDSELRKMRALKPIPSELSKTRTLIQNLISEIRYTLAAMFLTPGADSRDVRHTMNLIENKAKQLERRINTISNYELLKEFEPILVSTNNPFGMFNQPIPADEKLKARVNDVMKLRQNVWESFYKKLSELSPSPIELATLKNYIAELPKSIKVLEDSVKVLEENDDETRLKGVETFYDGIVEVINQSEKHSEPIEEPISRKVGEIGAE